MEVLKEELLYADIDGYVEIDSVDLRETLVMEIDDEGNLFDPKEQKLIEAKQEQAERNTVEKPSILKQIKEMKVEEKEEKTKETKK